MFHGGVDSVRPYDPTTTELGAMAPHGAEHCPVAGLLGRGSCWGGRPWSTVAQTHPVHLGYTLFIHASTQNFTTLRQDHTGTHMWLLGHAKLGCALNDNMD